MKEPISLDKASQEHLFKQFDKLINGMGKSADYALERVGMKLKTTAQNRIKDTRHIVTSRLRNSIFVKSKKRIQGNSSTYSDNKGHSFNGLLQSVSVGDNEIAVGTNVDYAENIELIDSYLYWSTKNVDITSSIADDLKKQINERR